MDLGSLIRKSVQPVVENTMRFFYFIVRVFQNIDMYFGNYDLWLRLNSGV